MDTPDSRRLEARSLIADNFKAEGINVVAHCSQLHDACDPDTHDLNGGVSKAMTATDRFLESALLLGFVEDHDYHREAAPMRSTGRLVLDDWFPEDEVESWFVEYKCDVCGDLVYVYRPETHERAYEALVQAGVLQRSDFGAAYGLVPDFPVAARIESPLLLGYSLQPDDPNGDTLRGGPREGVFLRSTGVIVAEPGLPLNDSTSWRLEYWCQARRKGVYRWDLSINYAIRLVLIFRGILNETP